MDSVKESSSNEFSLFRFESQVLIIFTYLLTVILKRFHMIFKEGSRNHGC